MNQPACPTNCAREPVRLYYISCIIYLILGKALEVYTNRGGGGRSIKPVEQSVKENGSSLMEGG